MIPQFPKLKRLELEDRTEVEKHTKDFPSYSDYSFASLYSYNVSESIELSYLNQNLVIKFEDYITGEFFFSFLGKNKIKETVDLLMQEAKKRGIIGHLSLFPQANLNNGKEIPGYVIQEDLNNFDYILSLEKICCLEGAQFHDKRNLANRFNKENPDASVKLLDLMDEKFQKEILELFDQWVKQKKDYEDTEHEKMAIKRLLKASHNFNLVSLGIYKNSMLIAWAVTEIISDSWSISHFAKADVSFKGIYEALFRELARELMKKNCKFINYEQDLGIPGLRHSKQQWNPVGYLKKYIIRKK